MRINDLVPSNLQKELLRLYRLNPEWCKWKPVTENRSTCLPVVPTFLSHIVATGADWFGMKAMSHWLGSGPKIFRPTKEQCLALENVEVNLRISEYSQPYPAILVEVDYPPFNSVLCYKEENLLIFSLHSCPTHENDIVTTVARTDTPIEESLTKFADDCVDTAAIAAKALRVACNSCLALSHYENYLEYLYPKEVERDIFLKKERSERGVVARERISLAVQILRFNQEVKLHNTESSSSSEGSRATGREMSTHWRRGHWAMQAYGPNSSLRKRILRKPVLVRADLFVGDISQTQTIYK